MSQASRPRRLLALATGNWHARAYLAVVGASVLSTFLFPDSFLAMAPILLTAPLSFLPVVLPFGPGTQGSPAVEALAVGIWTAWLLACALVNAAVLGALASGAAGDGTGVARPGTGGAMGRAVSRWARPAAGAVRRGTPSAPRRNVSQRLRALLAPAVDNWPARGYLAVVAAALGFFLVAAYALPDPGFAGIWPIMATAPMSFLVLASVPGADAVPEWLSPLLFTAGTVVAGLVNAVLLGRLAHRLRSPQVRPVA
ncbi:SCO4225 family membrane protein [Streptomyces sp. NPDC057253]|uniref:SCO4225 family membrane protein n=1 Tax=Streptomyces sp. NPDC057253 TaxID=3346069 RepID=UPI003643D4DC